LHSSLHKYVFAHPFTDSIARLNVLTEQNNRTYEVNNANLKKHHIQSFRNDANV